MGGGGEDGRVKWKTPKLQQYDTTIGTQRTNYAQKISADIASWKCQRDLRADNIAKQQ